jgi:hypothetical protein
MAVVLETPEGAIVLSPEQLEELKQAEQALREEKTERLNKLGESLADKRIAAIQARRTSGMEQRWDECEEAYRGEDAATMAERNAYSTRPVGQAMPKTDDGARSTIVLNITKPYVNAFASKISDMRFQASERFFKMENTPSPHIMTAPNAPIGAPNVNPQLTQPVPPDGTNVVPITPETTPMFKAIEAAAKAQKRIDDWLSEGAWDTEARAVIDDMARIGTGVLKGPYPDYVEYRRIVDGQPMTERVVQPRS